MQVVYELHSDLLLGAGQDEEDADAMENQESQLKYERVDSGGRSGVDDGVRSGVNSARRGEGGEWWPRLPGQQHGLQPPGCIECPHTHRYLTDTLLLRHVGRVVPDVSFLATLAERSRKKHQHTYTQAVAAQTFSLPSLVSSLQSAHRVQPHPLLGRWECDKLNVVIVTNV
jgi:hypothetical protein